MTRLTHHAAAGAFAATLACTGLPAWAFGDAGYLPACASFTSCTATLASAGTWNVRYEVTNISGGYNMPFDLSPGIMVHQDHEVISTTAPLRVSRSVTAVPPFILGNFFVNAGARSQTDFAVNRALSEPARGVVGNDDQGGETAQIKITTWASASSAWRDVLSFSADGHLHGSVVIDGSSTVTSLQHFPSAFDAQALTGMGDWFYELRVWDVSNLSVSEDFELGGPTPVARVRLGRSGEDRASFSATAALDFDYAAGVSYVVTAELRSTSNNGVLLDLLHTAQLQDVQLVGGAQLTALSGHDYLLVVPEPASAWLWLLGLAGMAARRGLGRGAGR